MGRIVPRSLPTTGLFRTTRRLWAACAVLVLIVGLRGLNLVWELRRDALTGMERDTQVVGKVLAAQTSRYLALVDSGLRRMQDAVAPTPAGDLATIGARFASAEMHNFVLSLLQSLPQANAFAIIDATGKMVLNSRAYPAMPLDMTDRDYYRAFLADNARDLYVSPPSISRVNGKPVIFMARRMAGSDGHFAGVAVAVLDAEYLWNFYASLDMAEQRGIKLLREDGTILIRYPDPVPDTAIVYADIANWRNYLGTGGVFRSTVTQSGQPSIVSVHPLPDFPLVVNVSLRESAALVPWLGLMRLIGVQALVAAIGIVLLFYVIVRQFKLQTVQNRALADNAVALSDSEQRLRTYAELASDWFWEQDAEFRFSWTSDTSPAHRIGSPSDGLTRWGLVGASLTDPVWAKHLAELHAHLPFRDFRYERIGSAGGIRHVSINGTPVFDADGTFTGYRGTGRDVTAEVEAERQLRDARDRAEAANKAKSEFLANMSHELRTPLNAIIGFSELIVAQPFGKIEPRYSEFAQDILNSGKHLLDLINDLLDMSKIEAGQFELLDEQVDLEPLIRSCLTMVGPRAIEGQVALSYDDPDFAAVIRADRRAVRQILLNLMSNAVKFTAVGGTVTVRVEAVESGIAIVVADNGIGIAQDALDRLCEPFHQVDASISRRFGGTGLGLAITRKLLDLHGGHLRFQSAPDVGTTVWAVFPPDRIVRTG